MTSSPFRYPFLTSCVLALAFATAPSLLAQSPADVTVREAWAREATTTQPSTAAIDVALEFKGGSMETVPANVQPRASIGYQR